MVRLTMRLITLLAPKRLFSKTDKSSILWNSSLQENSKTGNNRRQTLVQLLIIDSLLIKSLVVIFPCMQFWREVQVEKSSWSLLLLEPNQLNQLQLEQGGRQSNASLSNSALFQTIVTWLILPVVICLSQRLSHACLSISCLYCETANGSLNQLQFI